MSQRVIIAKYFLFPTIALSVRGWFSRQ